mgnify:FL=1
MTNWMLWPVVMARIATATPADPAVDPAVDRAADPAADPAADRAADRAADPAADRAVGRVARTPGAGRDERSCRIGL